jgi:hypothetical protein
VELKIGFEETARLFEEIHNRAHWVITLERYITRQQIETLEPRPDILTVKEGVGASGLSTLIVSSIAGQKFIVDRLERKLIRIVQRLGEKGHENRVTREIAEQIYDETRRLAPRLALQAMGVSRVTEEILGLMIARHLADSHRPVNPKDGVVVWISLDEHQDWFRGANATRADLCRICLERRDGEILADILVVEGKLRQAFDPHGVEQVTATLALLEDMLPALGNETSPIDARLWREQILLAMESVNPEARQAFGSSLGDPEGEKYKLPADMRSEFRLGNFSVRSLSGFYSLCCYDQAGKLDISTDANTGIEIARSFNNNVLELVSREPNEPPTPPNEAEPPSTGGQAESDENSGESSESADKEGTDAEIDDGSGSERGKLSDVDISSRYQRILDKFGEFSIPVHMPDDLADRFVEGPASVLYRLRPGAGVDPRRVYERADALKLALALGEEQNIRFGIDKGFITIDVPKNQEDRYFVDAAEMWPRWRRPDEALAAPIGEDRLGNVVAINFSSSNSPHLLIGGTTGSGKSEALNTILTGLVRHYPSDVLKLLLVDPKGTELQQFMEDHHLEGEIGWDEEDAIKLLTLAVEQMQWRYERFREKSIRSLPEYNGSVGPEERIPWWVIVLDEYADLTSDPEAKKKIEALLKRLAQKARAAGIHVIIATQKPSAEVISTNLRSNLPAQLALRVRSGIESRVILDETGAETLNGLGDAFLKSEGRLTRVQCAMV